jgi:hypothetical protein
VGQKKGTGKKTRGLKSKIGEIAGKMNQNPKAPSKKPFQQIVCGKKNGQAYMVARAH